MSYRVVAPLVIARDKEGKAHHRYADEIIDWLDDDQAAHFVETGLVEQLGGSDDDDDVEAGPSTKAEWVAYAEELAAELTEAGEEVEAAPAKGDTKAEWVAYAERLQEQRDALAE